MLSMRDQAFAWLAEVEAEPGEMPFTVTSMQDHDCDAPNALIWREVDGTFKSPLFLTKDPNEPGVAFLALDENGLPLQNGFTDARFSISIPCSILEGDDPIAHPIVLGHGLFGSGRGMTDLVPTLASSVGPWTYVAGATDWRGLSELDVQWVINDVVGVGESKLNNFPALPDRLRQGMLNTLVLAKMMKRGLFNRDTLAFRTPAGAPVFHGPDTEMFYYGISLGGIMGSWFAALTPDVERLGVDVPAINFSCLLQRSTEFGQFELLLQSFGLTDPLQTILGIQLLHEVWVAGEPAGYARHITTDPLPGSGNPKHIFLSVAWLDKAVANQCTEVEARTLGLSNLTPASIQRELQGIPDREGPLDSAYVMFDTGAFDLFDPAQQQFIPPLTNLLPSPVCNPHGDRPLIPDGIRMLTNFLRPGGQVENFCTDLCDAGQPSEIAGGAQTPCDPLAH
jgi:pimeloyl-ACP methyl ester carboxylesterase